MKLMMVDDFRKARSVENPIFIPRVGDEVDMGYTPPQVVRRVIYMPKENLIVARVGDEAYKDMEITIKDVTEIKQS